MTSKSKLILLSVAAFLLNLICTVILLLHSLVHGKIHRWGTPLMIANMAVTIAIVLFVGRQFAGKEQPSSRSIHVR
jgi:hypothetical protein